MAVFGNNTARLVSSCVAGNIIYASSTTPCDDSDTATTSPGSLMGPLTWILFVYILLSVVGFGVLFATGWLDLRLNVNTRLIDAMIRSRIENEYIRYVRRHHLFTGSIRPPSINAEIMQGDTVARWMARERYLHMTGFEDLDAGNVRDRRITRERGPSNYPQRISSISAVSASSSVQPDVRPVLPSWGGHSL